MRVKTAACFALLFFSASVLFAFAGEAQEKAKPAPLPSGVMGDTTPIPSRRLLNDLEKARQAAEQAHAAAEEANVDGFRAPADQKLADAEAEYGVFSLKHAEKAYEWQHTSTIIIFWVVIMLMVAGIVFSWIQFRQGMHHPAQPLMPSLTTVSTAEAVAAGGEAAAAPEVTMEKNAVTEFSASPQGIKVASSTLGVIILVISMCFFYMYLRYVYPISIQNANETLEKARQLNGQ
jgi:hypothetical protein